MILIFSCRNISAQDLIYKDKNIGFNFGVVLGFGTHIQRFGLVMNFFYCDNQFQANSEVRAYYSFKNLGPKFIYPEIILSQGFVFSFGPKRNFFNPFLNSVSNQTRYTNCIAYSYNAYFNKKKTTQQTGIINISIDKFSLITENDILARPLLDRFRTAAFLLQYQPDSAFQFAINCTMWTGQYRHKKEIDDTHFYHHCYMDTTRSVYTNYSHGLLSAQVKYNVAYSQNAQMNIGIDADQVRNAVQNKFIHDMKFIPRSWNKARNCHMPMIDKNGNQFLYQEGQEVRNSKFYLNLFGNGNLFY